MKNIIKVLAVVFVSLFFTGYANACHCTNLIPNIDSLQQVQHYDFIALVKITDDRIFKQSTPGDPNSIGILGIKIIELFKGEAVMEVLEQSIQTSCDMGIQKGEEWLVFGTKVNGKISIRNCDRNALYKDLGGFR